MLKHGRENILRNCLICWRCGAWCGPAHYELRDGSVYCGICGDRNPLENMWKMSMQDLTEPRLIWIPWTRSGTAAHAISPDGRTPLGLDYVLLCRDIRAGSSLYRDERSAACETSQRHGAGRKRLHCGQRYTGEPQEPLQDRLEQAVRKAPSTISPPSAHRAPTRSRPKSINIPAGTQRAAPSAERTSSRCRKGSGVS